MKYQMPMIRLNVALLWIALCVSLAGNWIQHSVYNNHVERTISEIKAKQKALYYELHPDGEEFSPEAVQGK